MIKLHFLAISHDEQAVKLEDRAGIKIGWKPESCWIVPANEKEE
jgi:hypothetical protein